MDAALVARGGPPPAQPRGRPGSQGEGEEAGHRATSARKAFASGQRETLRRSLVFDVLVRHLLGFDDLRVSVRESREVILAHV